MDKSKLVFDQMIFQVRGEIYREGSGKDRQPSVLNIRVTGMPARRLPTYFEKTSGRRVKVDALMTLSSINNPLDPYCHTWCLEEDIEKAKAMISERIKHEVAKNLEFMLKLKAASVEPYEVEMIIEKD